MIVLFPGLAAAVDVCFPESEAIGILNEVQEGRINRKIIAEFRAIEEQYSAQAALYEADMKALKEQIVKDEKVVTEYRDIIQENEATCKRLIKAARPSFFDKLRWAGSGAGIVAVLALVAII